MVYRLSEHFKKDNEYIRCNYDIDDFFQLMLFKQYESYIINESSNSR